MLRSSRHRAQRSAQIIRMESGHQLFDRSVGFPPQRKCFGEKRSPGWRDGEATTALVLFIDRNLHQPAAFKRFKDRRQRGAVHGEQRRDAADGGRLRPRFSDISRENWPWVRSSGRNTSSKRRASPRAARCTCRHRQLSRTRCVADRGNCWRLDMADNRLISTHLSMMRTWKEESYASAILSVLRWPLRRGN